jgi:hypothetical protein
MNRAQLFATLAKAGIDPAKTFPGLQLTQSQRLRAPTTKELAIIFEHVTGFSFNNTVGASSPMAPLFKGWNVWAVWQVQDLPFNPLMVGVSRDRQLQIWVEDHVRLEAPEAQVADPIDLKGSQIQILTGPPSLQVAQRKEDVPGPSLSVDTQDLPPQLRFVRFFNRGEASQLPWPHDSSYLLDAVFQPNPSSPVTTGDGPGTITDRNITKPGTEAAKTAIETALVVALVAAVGYAAFLGLSSRR